MIKKIIYSIGIIFLLSPVLSGCQTGPSEKEGVTVTIEPFKYFVDQLTSEKIPVNVMVPMGSSPATYSPTTGQLMALSSASLYVKAGHLGFEEAWMERLKELNPEMEITDLSDGIHLISGEDQLHGDHVHESGIDPHIWMSPKVVLHFLPHLKDALIKNFPEEKSVIEKNYKSLLTEVETLHNSFENLPGQVKSPRFMIFHPALTYLARDYGLEQISIEYEGKEPSPRKLRELIDRSLEEDIKIIFIQEEFDQRNAAMVRDATGATLVSINPLGYNWTQVMQNIHVILKTIDR
jgi:zinc transport system substrate-binding protein